MATKKSELEIKVMAVNLLREYALKYLKYELEHFNKFIGIDIFKVDGSIKQKYDHEKLSFSGQLKDGSWVDVHYYFNKYSTSMDMAVKICVNGGSYDTTPKTAFCHYEQLTVELYTLVENKLQASTADRNYLNERFDEASLLEKAAKVKQKAQEYEAALNSVNYLFRDVLNLYRLTR